MKAGRALRGLRARRSGRRAEWIAALLLMAKGYRIIGFRLVSNAAEIDLLAVRGQVLAVVEVKSRMALETALAAVSYDQRSRLRRAGRQIAAARGDLRELGVRLDLVALAPGKLPRHIAGAWDGEV